jgi:hypothetical protein
MHGEYSVPEGVAPEAANPYEFAIDPKIEGLSSKELEQVSKAAREVIAARISGIEYAEGRRTQLTTIAGAVTAVGVAFLPLSGTTNWTPLRWAMIAAGLSSIAVGVAVWVLFAIQTNYKYPFLPVPGTWKWFYHGAIPNEEPFGPTTRTSVLSALATSDEGRLTKKIKVARAQEKLAYEQEFDRFTYQVDGLADPRIDATQDLRQLFLLHMNELYKNKFLTQLRRVLLHGLILVLAASTIGFVIGFVIESRTVNRSSSVSQDGARVTASWDATGATRTNGISNFDVEYRITVRVANSASSTITIRTLVALDRNGRSIPAEFLLASELRQLPPGQTAIVNADMWLAAVDRTSLGAIGIR